VGWIRVSHFGKRNKHIGQDHHQGRASGACVILFRPSGYEVLCRRRETNARFFQKRKSHGPLLSERDCQEEVGKEGKANCPVHGKMKEFHGMIDRQGTYKSKFSKTLGGRRKLAREFGCESSPLHRGRTA